MRIKHGRGSEINTYTFIVVLAQFDHLLRVSTRLVKLFKFGIGRGTIVQNTNGVAIFLIQRLNLPLARQLGTSSGAATSLKASMAALKSHFWYNFWPR